MLVSIESIDKFYLGNPVLQQVSATIEDHDRIGLIGANGAGKSTLLRLICDLESPDAGEIARSAKVTIGFLQQNSGLESNNTILEEMKSVFSDLLKIQSQMKQIEVRLADESLKSNPEEYQRLTQEYAHQQTYFEQRDGYLMEVKINTILNGMGFGDKPKETLIQTLSGGEKTRLAMAKLLLEQPDLLILDEPTNHLDFKTLMWLEDYLREYKGALLVVSHDRYFLDQTVQTIWEVEQHKLLTFRGNYSRYTVLKQEYVERQMKEYEIQQKQIASMQDYIDRNMARASTSKMAKSRQHALDRMEIVERPACLEKPPRIQFFYDKEPVKDILDVQDLTLMVGRGETQKTLAQHLNLHLFRGEKFAIIGENGIGKSSFLKAVQHIIPIPEGKIRWGTNTRISYYRQEMDQLNPNNTVLEELWSRFPHMNEQQIRSALGGVLLTGENVYKKVEVISGGEKAKLSLAIIMMERPNVLVMDEPTNHLDLRTKEVLEQALVSFSGTILMVSHDRYLLNKVPSKIIDMRRDGIHVYSGKFDDYLEQTQKEQQAVQQQEQDQPVVIKKATNGYKTKQQKAAEAKMRARLRELERLIEQTELDIAQLEEEMTKPDVYENYLAMNEACSKLEEYKQNHSSYFEEWAELSELV